MDAYTDTRFPDLFSFLRNSVLPKDSWLENANAFTTRVTPKPVVVWEAEITAARESAHFIGYAREEGGNPQYGSLSPTTFSVADTTYTVASVGYDSVANRVEIDILPAPPFSFTLSLGGSDFPSDRTAVRRITPDGSGVYEWADKGVSLAAGDVATVTITIPLLDICDRSEKVRDKLLALTPSYDLCDGVSRFELAEITDLTFTTPIVIRLKNGDFDGLTGLERLDLSGQGLFHVDFYESYIQNLAGSGTKTVYGTATTCSSLSSTCANWTSATTTCTACPKACSTACTSSRS